MLGTTRLTAGALCLAAASTALGCGYDADLGSNFGALHPDSVVVAVAMRKAADHGVINLEKLDTPGHNQVLLRDATLRLHALNAAVSAPAASRTPPVAFSIVLVETALWSRIRVEDGAAQIEVHTDGALDGDPVVLTGKPVLAKLLDGTLSLERALADGLVVIDGSDSEREVVHKVLAAALSR